ncbi:MAG: hypothetical protein ACE5JI_06975, partial [Acidobacteriota bacterium]
MVKSGINLASRSRKSARALTGWLAMLALMAASACHGWVAFRAHDAASRLRAEIGSEKDRLDARAPQAEAARRALEVRAARILPILLAAESGGATRAVSPVDVLSLLAGALPGDVKVVSVGL